MMNDEVQLSSLLKMAETKAFDGACALIAGHAESEFLYSSVPLSFWGGVDSQTGDIIDRHHPLVGKSLKGRILAIPRGRGSCTGSSVLLELVLNGSGPAGIVMAEPDEIISLGVLVAALMFEKSIPVFCVGQAAFERLADARKISLRGTIMEADIEGKLLSWQLRDAANQQHRIALRTADMEMLDGKRGPAKQFAMRLVLRMADLFGAVDLIDVKQAHIDGCIYTGRASLEFAEQLLTWRAQVAIPTSLNSISVDRRRWRELGVDPSFGEPADRLGAAYVEMGAKPTFTCAPYLLDSAPDFGDQIVWGESNAVAFANSVLGARTLKCPDYLDICVALTARAPFVGPYQVEGREARIHIDVEAPDGFDDSFYPLLGYCIGLQTGVEIPVVCGLEALNPTLDDLKAFSAAFATTSAAPMFHISGVTPEAPTAVHALAGKAPARQLRVTAADLVEAWLEFNGAVVDEDVQLVSLGNPHLSVSECAAIAEFCSGKHRFDGTSLVLTMGRSVFDKAAAAGHIDKIEQFGAIVITDTCWCMIEDPVIPPGTRTLMTNSGKYAHYGPGLVKRHVRFGSLASCLEAAASGKYSLTPPKWLTD